MKIHYLYLADQLKKKTDGLLDVDLDYSLLPKSISCILLQSPPCVCVCLPSPCIFHLHISSAYILFLYASLLRMYTLCVSFVGMPFLSVPYQCVSNPPRYGSSLCVYHVSVNIYPLSVRVLSLCVSRRPCVSIPCPYGFSLCVYHAPLCIYPSPSGSSLCAYHISVSIYPLSEWILSLRVFRLGVYLVSCPPFCAYHLFMRTVMGWRLGLGP